jgi:uncharacterized membrane protein
MKNLGSGESKLETIVSYLLIIGVVLSLALIVTGLVLFYLTYGHLNILFSDKDMFIRGNDFFNFIYLLVSGHYAMNNAILFIVLGIVVLLLTPFLRVVASVIYFAWRKEGWYVLITVFVLVALTLSLALH